MRIRRKCLVVCYYVVAFIIFDSHGRRAAAAALCCSSFWLLQPDVCTVHVAVGHVTVHVHAACGCACSAGRTSAALARLARLAPHNSVAATSGGRPSQKLSEVQPPDRNSTNGRKSNHWTVLPLNRNQANRLKFSHLASIQLLDRHLTAWAKSQKPKQA